MIKIFKDFINADSKRPSRFKSHYLPVKYVEERRLRTGLKSVRIETEVCSSTHAKRMSATKEAITGSTDLESICKKSMKSKWTFLTGLRKYEKVLVLKNTPLPAVDFI